MKLRFLIASASRTDRERYKKYAIRGATVCGIPDGGRAPQVRRAAAKRVVVEHARLGTHQDPSTSPSCAGEAGALRSGRVVLSCPSHYYGPLRLPLGRLALPGVTGYKQDCFPDRRIRGRGGSLQFRGQPSGHSEPPAPGGSWTPAPRSLVSSVAFALREQARLLLVRLQRRTGVTTLQASRDVTDWSFAPPRFEPGLSTTLSSTSSERGSAANTSRAT